MMKHIEIDFHFVRDLVKTRNLQVKFLSTKDLIVDLRTKPLTTNRFIYIWYNLNVCELPLRLKDNEYVEDQTNQINI